VRDKKKVKFCPMGKLNPLPMLEEFGAAGKDPQRLNEFHSDDSTVYVLKQHYMPHDHAVGDVLYILRDGRDATLSYARFDVHNAQRDGQPWTYEERVRYHMDVDANWANHVTRWKQSGKIGATVRYENLCNDPFTTELRDALSSLGYVLKPKKAMPPFTELHAKDPNFFRKGRAGSHKEEFPEKLLAGFNLRFGEVLRKFGYAADST
jgi:hypothetical protein